MVVVGTANVGVEDGRRTDAVRRQRLLIEAMAQNGSHTLIAVSLQHQRSRTGSLQSIIPVGFAQSHNAQARTKALERMDAGGEDRGDELGGGGTTLLRPAHEPLRGPFHVGLMGLGHMGGYGRMLALEGRATMTTDPLAFMETFHTVGGEPHIDPLADQRIRDGIIMMIDFDMVIDVHGGFLPVGVFIGRGWQRPQRGLVEGEKATVTGAREFLELAPIENDERLVNGGIEFG